MGEDWNKTLKKLSNIEVVSSTSFIYDFINMKMDQSGTDSIYNKQINLYQQSFECSSEGLTELMLWTIEAQSYLKILVYDTGDGLFGVKENNIILTYYPISTDDRSAHINLLKKNIIEKYISKV